MGEHATYFGKGLIESYYSKKEKKTRLELIPLGSKQIDIQIFLPMKDYAKSVKGLL